MNRLLELQDMRVSRIGDLSQNQQVVAAEALRRLALPFRVAVALREGDIVARLSCNFDLPYRLLDSTGPNFVEGFLVSHFLCPAERLSVRERRRLPRTGDDGQTRHRGGRSGAKCRAAPGWHRQGDDRRPDGRA